MTYTERPFLFDCAGEQLVGIVSLPPVASVGAGAKAADPDVGLLIIVGGPQYRIGSHRLFVQLARHAAVQGVAAMRFDYRGMGDATGPLRSFEAVDDDLQAAINAFQREVPSLQRIVLWGLCEGASAACMYAPHDARVHGFILLNPWVHTEEGAVQAKLRYYYLKRLFSAALWRKLLSGQMPQVRPLIVHIITLLRLRLRKTLGLGRGSDTRSTHDIRAMPLPQRTGHLLSRSSAPVAVMLSDDDKVAREFEAQAMPTPEWQAVQRQQWLALQHLRQADHTVTTPEAKQQLCEQTVAWVKQMAAR